MGKPEPLPEAEGEQEEEKSKDKEKNKSSRKSKEQSFPKNLTIEEVERITPEEVLKNPEKFRKIGESHHDLLHHQRSKLLWHRTVTEKYVPREDKKAPPLSAPAPLPPISGAAITPQLASQIVIGKYCDHLPHYRQSRIWKREYDVSLGRQTINRWTHAVAEHLFPIYDALGCELRSAQTLQLDETPLDYLKAGHGKTKKGYLWVMRNPVTKAVYYHWETTRSKEGLKRTLGWNPQTNTVDFAGTIQCDGYSAYQSLHKELSGLTLGGCLAHIRRRFIQDESFVATAWGAHFLKSIQRLYQIETKLKKANAPPDQRRRVRQEYAKPIVIELQEKLLSQKINYRPKSSIGVAISYALNQWDRFAHYLEDGTLEIDNNGVENAIRPTKLGAKNFLFIGSAEAGTNTAVLYTLLENCKVLGLNPRDYLEHVITAIHIIEPVKLTPAQISHQLQTDTKSVA